MPISSNEERLPINVLIIEDSEDDAILLVRELKKGGFEPKYLVVDDLPAMAKAIETDTWDIIITDYVMPKFSGIDAIRLVQNMNLDIPVIIVSGVVGEETAVEAMRAGAKDYLIKFNYIRLTATIRRELEEAKNRAQKKHTEFELKKLFSELEALVEERTLKLKQINEKLTEEISYRSKIEEDLRQSEAKLTKIFEISPAPIAISRLEDTSIIEANASMLELLESQRVDIIGKTGLDFIKFSNTKLPLILNQHLIKNGFFRNQEAFIQTKSGRVKTVLLSAELADVETDKWVIYLALDITDRKNAELEIENALSKERDLSALKSRFISTVSHEIRTPLTNIMLSTDLLKRHSEIWDESDRQKHFKRIQDTVLRIIRLMENALLVGKLDTELFENRPDLINIKAFLDEILIQINSATNSSDRIILNRSELKNKEVIIDENLCGSILTNIISNALTYSPSDKKVEINLTQENEMLYFSIKDQGIGIPEEDKAKVFIPFYRGANVGSISGYGLGLTIAKKMR